MLTRGFWLVFLEVAVVHFGWIPDPSFRINILQVIWVIGWSMVLLSAVSFLSSRVVLVLGVGIIVGHNLLDGVSPADWGDWGWCLDSRTGGKLRTALSEGEVSLSHL